MARGESQVVDVRWMWGDTMLRAVQHPVAQPFLVDAEEGVECTLLVLHEGGTALVVREQMRGVVQLPGKELQLLSQCAPGLLVLPLGTFAQVDLRGDLRLVLRVAPAAPAMASGFFAGAGRLLGATAASVALLAALSVGMRVDAFARDDIERDADQMAQAQRLLRAASAREPARIVVPDAQEPDGEKPGARARHESGQMGRKDAAAAHLRAGVHGVASTPDIELARHEAANFGAIGLLSAGMSAESLAPSAAWGNEVALARDALSAQGNMQGLAIGDASGFGGLGLSGIGEGSGGDGRSIGRTGIGGEGGFGGGACGCAEGNSGRGRMARSVNIGLPHAQVSGRLPPEAIQRVVRQNQGRFRSCYEPGLRTNPSLEGRVAVKFVIDRTGAVSTAADGGSDLPDSNVVSCVVRAFSGLSFPAPEGGIVTVSYPFSFSPGT